MKSLFENIRRRNSKLTFEIWLLFSLLIIISVTLLWLLRSGLFQEPLSIAISTAQLEVSGNNWIMDDSSHRSIIKTYAFQEYLNYLEADGWKYVDQMGSGYLFKRVNKSAILTCRQYSRRYRICTGGPYLSKTD